MFKKRYPSDLNDAQWAAIREIYEPFYKRQGRPPSPRLREIWNAILYITRSGCAWRMLPKDFPHWKTVYYHTSRMKRSGLLDEILHCLREKARLTLGRELTPSVAIVDSQSVKSRSTKKIRQRI